MQMWQAAGERRPVCVRACVTRVGSVWWRDSCPWGGPAGPPEDREPGGGGAEPAPPRACARACAPAVSQWGPGSPRGFLFGEGVGVSVQAGWGDTQLGSKLPVTQPLPAGLSHGPRMWRPHLLGRSPGHCSSSEGKPGHTCTPTAAAAAWLDTDALCPALGTCLSCQDSTQAGAGTRTGTHWCTRRPRGPEAGQVAPRAGAGRGTG